MQKDKNIESWTRVRKVLEALRTLDLAFGRVEVALLFILLMVLIFAEIVGSFLRDFCQSNLAWIEQLLKYFVVWIGMLGASLATQTKEHISIEVVSKFTGPRMGRILSVLVNFMACIVTFTMAFAASNYILNVRREYNMQGGRSGFFTFENIHVYECPTKESLKIEERETAFLKAYGYADLLKERILPQQNYERITITPIQEAIQQNFEITQKTALSEVTKAWIQKRWLEVWRQEAKTAWEKHGLPIWKEKGENAIRPETLLAWQSQWMSHMWESEGKALSAQAWKNEGQPVWEKEKDQSDFNEDEFESEWKDEWIRNTWKAQWQEQMNRAWQEGEAQKTFQKVWIQDWICTMWDKKGKAELDVFLKHSATYWHAGDCPICGQKLFGKPYQVPRWIFLVIIPWGLFMMGLRFGLHGLVAIFIQEQHPMDSGANAEKDSIGKKEREA